MTFDISLPDSLEAFVDEQVTQRGYGNSLRRTGNRAGVSAEFL